MKQPPIRSIAYVDYAHSNLRISVWQSGLANWIVEDAGLSVGAYSTFEEAIRMADQLARKKVGEWA